MKSFIFKSIVSLVLEFSDESLIIGGDFPLEFWKKTKLNEYQCVYKNTTQEKISILIELNKKLYAYADRKLFFIEKETGIIEYKSDYEYFWISSKLFLLSDSILALMNCDIGSFFLIDIIHKYSIYQISFYSNSLFYTYDKKLITSISKLKNNKYQYELGELVWNDKQCQKVFKFKLKDNITFMTEMNDQTLIVTNNSHGFLYFNPK